MPLLATFGASSMKRYGFTSGKGPYIINYLAVAGGSGGSGGGGGAGGPQSGATNTGGGGAGYYGGGGSGIVIFSVPTGSYSGITTGTPTITTSGLNTIIQFTSSGSFIT